MSDIPGITERTIRDRVGGRGFALGPVLCAGLLAAVAFAGWGCGGRTAEHAGAAAPSTAALRLDVPPAAAPDAPVVVATPSESQQPPQQQPLPIGGARIEVADVSAYPLVDVELAGGARGRFAFDTGAGAALLVDGEFLERAGAGAESGGEAWVNRRRYRRAALRGMEVVGTDFRLRYAPGAAVDLEGFRWMCGGTRVDAVFGPALAPDLEFDLDYPNGRLEFRPAERGVRPDGAMRLPPAPDPQGRGRPVVALQIGSRRVPALLDSCDFEALRIPDHMLEGSGVELSSPRPSRGSVGFAARMVEARRGEIDGMTIGPLRIERPQVQVLSDPRRRQNKAVIGSAVLKHYRLVFNPHAGSVLVVGPPVLVAPAPDPRAVQIAEGMFGGAE